MIALLYPLILQGMGNRLQKTIQALATTHSRLARIIRSSSHPLIQKVFFISQINEDGFQWILNGIPIGRAAKATPWTPRAGKYSLAIADGDEKILDYVYFDVRGPEAD